MLPKIDRSNDFAQPKPILESRLRILALGLLALTLVVTFFMLLGAQNFAHGRGKIELIAFSVIVIAGCITIHWREKRRFLIMQNVLLVVSWIALLVFADTAFGIESLWCLSLSVVALIFYSWPQNLTVAVGQVAVFVALVTSLAFLSLAIHIPHSNYGFSRYANLDISATILLSGLSAGILLGRPDAGIGRLLFARNGVGFLARRLYLTAFVVPLTLEAALLFAEKQRWMNGKVGLAAFALLNMLLLIGLTSIILRSFSRSDGARKKLGQFLLEEKRLADLAHDLHDELGQHLTALKSKIEFMEKTAPHPEFGSLRTMVQDAMIQVRQVSGDLRPAMLDDLGLLAAVNWLTDKHREQTGLDINVVFEGMNRRFPKEIETAAFRILQEALSNAARHSGTRAVTLRVISSGVWIHLEVIDRGRGFEPKQANRGLGLVGMRERALALRGRFRLDAKPEHGTSIYADLPCEVTSSHEE